MKGLSWDNRTDREIAWQPRVEELKQGGLRVGDRRFPILHQLPSEAAMNQQVDRKPWEECDEI